MRSRTWKPSSRPCLQGHGVDTYAEFERMCSNIRPWPGEDLLVGECRRCGSTIAWKLHPTRFDEPEENPIMRRKNPQMGTHPDLFEGSSPIFVPLEDVPADKLLALPRRAFNSDEWDELNGDDQEYIYENDEESKNYVENFVSEFVKRYAWATSGDHVNFSSVEEYFEEWLREVSRTDRLIEMADGAGYGASEWIEEQTGLGYSDEQARKALEEALQDSNVYEFQRDTSETGKAFFKDRVTESFYMDSSYVGELVEEVSFPKGGFRRAMFPDEIQRALEEVDRQTSRMAGTGLDLSVDVIVDLKKPRDAWAREVNVDDVISYYFDADPNWDKVIDNAVEALTEEDPLGPLKGEPPPEERVVHRWKDGFYVQDLTPQELAAEGRIMGMCVGRPDMGYGKAVRDKEIKILSLRRPNGKPLFTLEADLDYRGDISGCQQIAGKANREPGFDLGKADPDAPIKKDEVERLIDLLIELGLDPAECVSKEGHPSMGPALFWIIRHQGDDLWARKMVEKVKSVSGYAATYFQQVNPSRRRNAAICGVDGDHSTCIGFCTPYRRRR